MATLISYIIRPDGTQEAHTYDLNNANHHKALLSTLHDIANGLPKGTRITFSTEL